MSASVLQGRCRYCGGTDDEPARLPDGEEAGWLNEGRDVCTAPGCMRSYWAEQRRVQRKQQQETRALEQEKRVLVREIRKRWNQHQKRKREWRERAASKRKGGRQ